MLFWVPQSGNIGMGVSILSYAGGVQFGLITDKRLCEEPQRIIDRFEPEFEKLVLALCMVPWNGSVDADEVESRIFPRVDVPRSAPRASPRPRANGKRAQRRSAAAPQKTKFATAAPEAGPDAKARPTPRRPPGLRRRKSAFAAARDGAE